jgi:hypothetical protein
MTITNATLINLVTTLGETRAAELLESKLKHDAQQKAYHTKYNARKNAITREVTAMVKASGLNLEQILAAATAQGKKNAAKVA